MIFMKKVFFLAMVLAAMLPLNAQNGITLTKGKPVLVYALPKTELCIEIVTETTKQKPGIFYQYSERYLATNQVITEEKTTVRLKSIRIFPRAVADPNRTYTLTPRKSSVLNNICVNPQGILCGINTEVPVEQHIKKEIIKEKNSRTIYDNGLLPLGEEFMMAGSSAKLAEGAAKQIYRIRESRMSLLTADVEHLPADGASMKAMLNGMDEQEQELTELFIGKTTTDTQHKTIVYVPDSAVNQQVVFRISTFNGIVDTDDLSGKPYYISIEPAKIKTQLPGEKEKIEKAAINTILPARTKIVITDGVNEIYNQTIDIPQLGEIVPLGEGLFASPKVKVKIDPHTGRLISIE